MAAAAVTDIPHRYTTSINHVGSFSYRSNAVMPRAKIAKGTTPMKSARIKAGAEFM